MKLRPLQDRVLIRRVAKTCEVIAIFGCIRRPAAPCVEIRVVTLHPIVPTPSQILVRGDHQ